MLRPLKVAMSGDPDSTETAGVILHLFAVSGTPCLVPQQGRFSPDFDATLGPTVHRRQQAEGRKQKADTLHSDSWLLTPESSSRSSHLKPDT